MTHLFVMIALLLAPGPSTVQAHSASRQQLLTEVQRRAVRFFWENADPETGLISDRAVNRGKEKRPVCSIASNGYGFIALALGAKHDWLDRQEARDRAAYTLDYLLHKLPNEHGWFYHFVDKRTGARYWNCEVSTIDTALLVQGALIAGQYFGGDVKARANALYARLDWQWALTNGGDKPNKLLLSHGWTPDKGFLPNDWGSYCEHMFLYFLGMGAQRDPLSAKSWSAWQRNVHRYSGFESLELGPIFMHQMAHGFYDFKDKRDRMGYDYWASSVGATLANRKYCTDFAARNKTYKAGYWGLNAGDGPKGYSAYGTGGPQDGTVSPTGVLASISFAPELCLDTAMRMYTEFGDRIWGQYGFADTFNLEANWFDPDVIGIDLGMALVAIENYRTRFIWKVMESHPSTRSAFQKAGFRVTNERTPRAVFRNPAVGPRVRRSQGVCRYAGANKRPRKLARLGNI